MTATMSPPKPKPEATAESPDQYAPQRRKFSREEYYRMAEQGYFRGQRVERIHGEIYVMCPIGWKHSMAVSLIGETLLKAFGDNYFLLGQTTFETEDSDPEPDVTVLPGKQRSYRVDPRKRSLVVEVSDRSLNHDLGKKAHLYAAVGVLDYWVVDLVNLRVIVFRDPQPDATSETGFSYASQTEYAAGQSIVPLAAPNGASVAVADLLP